MTTDSEWEMIGALAGRAGMSVPRFLVERALESRDPAPEAGAPSALPPEVRRRMALAVLVLARVCGLQDRHCGSSSRTGGRVCPGGRM